MLSDPVDDEQWRTLGEGAAYRVLGPILRMQAGRSIAPGRSDRRDIKSEFKLASSLGVGDTVARNLPAIEVMAEQPVALKLDRDILRLQAGRTVAVGQSDSRELKADYKLALGLVSGLGVGRSPDKIVPSIAVVLDDALALKMDREIAITQPKRVSSVIFGGAKYVE